MKEDLLSKFLNGACTPEETEKIKKWILENEHDKDLEDLIRSHWEKLKDTDELHQSHHDLLDSIHASMEAREPAKLSPEHATAYIPFYLKIAASIVLCACTVWFSLHYFKRTDPTGRPTASAEVVIKQTGFGEKLTVVLPDSSVVTLNSSSSLEYPAVFSDSSRLVKLSGEAFFDVAHDTSRPFRVSAGALETTVLGTRFNIKSKERTVNVILAEGKVKLALKDTERTAVLLPGQMGSSDRTANAIAVQKADVEKLTAWKEGMVVLHSTSLDDVFTNLENWYGVRITVDKNVDLRKTVSGKFTNENLRDILSGLSFSLNFQFSMAGPDVVITKK
jgi:transmembrane sensor